MARFAVVYATMYGQTERIARAIEAVLTKAGHQVALHRLEALPAGFALGAFDRVLLAAPIYFGKYPKPFQEFVGRHVAELNARPTVLVSVCGSAGPDRTGKGMETARSYVDKLRTSSGWAPGEVEIVAGEVAYTKYGFVTRLLLRLINGSVGRSTDTSRDHDYTDWDAVRRFAERLAAS
jgi:menaquinone-dependent protoporphyrinogen oxidase